MVFERDGMIFSKLEYSWPCLASILACAGSKFEIQVLDWGGGFGSSYIQSRKYLEIAGLQVSWSIIELPEIVESANKNLRYPAVNWYGDIYSIQSHDFDVVLCGASINYVPTPYDVLIDLIKLEPRFLILDRTLISFESSDKIAVQINPESLHGSSYPVWILTENKILEFFTQNSFELVESWECALNPNPNAKSYGYFFKNTLRP